MSEPTTNPPANSMGLAMSAAGLALFAMVLGVISSGDNVLGWDLSFAQWIQRWQGGFGDFLYRIGDVLGTTSLAAAITVIVLIIAAVRKQVQISVFLILVLLLRLLGTQLKPFFDSPRPTADHLRLLETFDGTGYPSGHSMTVAMVASMLVLIARHYLRDNRINRAVTALSLLAVVLVGWSRIWAGAHWPSDVLGGWAFGIALVLIAWIISRVIAVSTLLRQGTAAEPARNSATPAK